jgi:hypothetical protein
MELMTAATALDLTDARVDARLVWSLAARSRVHGHSVAHVAARTAHAFVGPCALGARRHLLREGRVTSLARTQRSDRQLASVERIDVRPRVRRACPRSVLSCVTGAARRARDSLLARTDRDGAASFGHEWRERVRPLRHIEVRVEADIARRID